MPYTQDTTGEPSAQATEPRLADALAYAEAGFPLFPLAGKHPIEKPDEPNIDGVVIPQGMGGFHQATRDTGKIRRWAAAYPGCNWGTPTGHHTDAITSQPNARPLYVIDADVDKGGLETIETLQTQLGALPVTVTQITGSGGRHYCFTSPEDLRNSAGALGPGIDTRGTGGYIVLAPSIHPETDDPYIWALGQGLLEHHLAELPEAWRRAWRAASSKRESKAPGQKIPKGERNDTLYREACEVRRRGAGIDAILAYLRARNEEACEEPLADDELTKIAESATTYDPADPLVTLPLTESGNAERLIAAYPGELHYNVDEDSWLVWDGQRHARDAKLRIEKRALGVMRTTGRMAMEMTPADDEGRETKRKQVAWAIRSESNQAIKAMLARARPLVAVTLSELDADPWAFVCANGVLDLRTGELQPHDAAVLHTMMSPVTYDPDARSDLWNRYLDHFTGGDQAIKGFLQKLAGASLSGISTDQPIPNIIGRAGSGKTTFIEAISATFGDYAYAAAMSTFIAKAQANSGPEPEILAMARARLVTAVEADKGHKLASAFLKRLTGGDQITGRGMYAKRETTFTPGATPWLAANDAPKIDKNDSGLWRRVVLIPANNVVDEAERDPEVKLTLRNPEIAGPAILAWAVKGCLDWQADGLRIIKPPVIRAATDVLRASMDPLNQFIEEVCEVGEKHTESTGTFRTAYQTWCKQYRIAPERLKEMKASLQELGYSEKRTTKGPVYVGLRLAESEWEG